jgi:hypothetical protein
VRWELSICLGFSGRVGGAALFNGKGRQREFEF